jgi:hypothetical protein
VPIDARPLRRVGNRHAPSLAKRRAAIVFPVVEQAERMLRQMMVVPGDAHWRMACLLGAVHQWSINVSRYSPVQTSPPRHDSR